MTDLNSTVSPVVLDSFTNFKDNADGLLIHRQQEIPDGFLADLAARRLASHNQREGEFMLTCSIPVIVHEQWLKEGYDCTREPARKTIARLKAKGLDAFIATNKQV